MSYVIAGWVIGLSALGAYAFALLARGRRLSRLVAPDRQRWSTTRADTPTGR